MAVGSTPRDSGNIPLGCVLVPGDNTPQALQGGAEFTDAGGNISAPARMELTPGSKATFSAAITGLVPVTGATDIFTVTGSATKLVKITRLVITGSTTLAANVILPITLLKRSSADLTGTSTAPTRVAHDSLNAAVTATVLAYTANPGTLGTLVGAFRNIRMTLQLTPQTATDFPISLPYIEDFGQRGGQPIVLRGIAEVFAINLAAIATITGWLFDISVEWSEE
jgi:hypothetical protein